MKKSKRILLTMMALLFLLSSVCLDSAIVYQNNADSGGDRIPEQSLFHCVSDAVRSGDSFVNIRVNPPERAFFQSLTSTYVSRLAHRLKMLRTRRTKKITMSKPIKRRYR